MTEQVYNMLKDSTLEALVMARAGDSNFMDLRGVACPMNFVKAKLRMEMMELGETLELLLDDGRPIKNVPDSFRDEGQKVTEMTDIDNEHWLIKIVKIMEY